MRQKAAAEGGVDTPARTAAGSPASATADSPTVARAGGSATTAAHSPAGAVGEREASGSVWSGARRPLTIGLLLTVTLAAFEALAVATAMPVVGRELGMLALYGWAFSGFMLGNLIGIVVAGVLIDRRGLMTPYVLGVALFSAGLVIGGLAISMPMLIAGRAIQGVGAGAIPATAYVVVQREYPRRLRPVMFAYFSTAWVVPGLIGPVIAGTIAEHATWRLIFLGLLPFAAVAALLTVSPLRALEGSVPDTPSEGGTAGSGELASPRRILLAVRVAIGAALLLAALDVREPAVLAALAVAGLALALPALVQVLPPGALLARRGLPATVLLRGVLTFGFSGAEAYLPLMLVSVRGISPSAAGLTLTASTLTWAAGSWLQARWFERLGGRPLIGIGFATVAAGILSIVPVLRTDVPVALAVGSWALAGFGMGICFAPITMTVMNLARPSEQGAATAAVSFSDVVGTALGTGIGGAIVAFGAASGLDRGGALVAVFVLMAAVVAAGALLTGRVRPSASRK